MPKQEGPRLFRLLLRAFLREQESLVLADAPRERSIRHYTGKIQKELGLELRAPSFKLNTGQLVTVSFPPSGPNNCWVSPAPRHSSHSAAGKCSPHPGNMGTRREMGGRAGNRLRAPSLWPNILTPSYCTGSEKLHFKAELKWKQRLPPHFTQSGRHSQNFQTPLGKANVRIYCLKILTRLRLRHKGGQQAVQPFQDWEAVLCALKLIVRFFGKPIRRKLPIKDYESQAGGPNRCCFVGLKFRIYLTTFNGSTS